MQQFLQMCLIETESPFYQVFCKNPIVLKKILIFLLKFYAFLQANTSPFRHVNQFLDKKV